MVVGNEMNSLFTLTLSCVATTLWWFWWVFFLFIINPMETGCDIRENKYFDDRMSQLLRFDTAYQYGERHLHLILQYI